MAKIDRQRLSKYLQEKIEHSESPQSFQFQMQNQISKFLKAQEHQLKLAHSKIRINKLVEEDLLKRQQLRDHLQQKIQKSVDYKAKRMEDYSKSMAELRKRKQNMHTERIKQQKKKQLQQSLKRIEEIENKREVFQQSRLNRSASERVLNKYSKYQKRLEAENEKYNAIVERQNQREIFKIPSRIMSELYSEKAHHLKKAELEEKTREDRLAQSLNRIEQARKRKEALLADRSKKIEQAQKYQFEITKSKYKELQLQKYQKRKELMLHQGNKILKSESLYAISRFDPLRKQESGLSNPQKEELSEREKKVGCFREKIRKCIDSFVRYQKHS